MNRIQYPLGSLVPPMEKSVSFLISLAVHVMCLLFSGAMLVKPIEFAVESGVSSIEISLVPKGKQPPAPVSPKPPEVLREVVKPVIPIPEPAPEHPKPAVEIPKPLLEIPKPKGENPIVVPVPPVLEEKSKVVAPVQPVSTPQKVETIKKVEVVERKVNINERPVPQESQAASSGAKTRIKPNYLKNPPPSYPQESRRLGQEGVVLLTINVDRRGSPSMVSIKKSSGYSLLDHAALKAVRRWKFAAAQIGELKIESSVDVPIRFKLEEN